MSFSPDTLYYGDCLDWMSQWDDQCVDLIYADPPFNSKQDYSILFSDKRGELAQYRAFTDTWNWDMAAEDRLDRILGAVARPSHRVITGLHAILGESGALAYLTYMAERLEHVHRLLKPTGSLYLHCDPTMSHYLKLILDAIFGPQHFKNEVIWKRTGAHGRAKRWGPIHDVILYYAKSKKAVWNRIYEKYDPDYIADFYRFSDTRGKYQLVTLDGPGIRYGSSGKPWRDVDPSTKGRHWEVPPDNALPGDFEFPKGYSDMSCQERLDVLDDAGMVYWPPRGTVPRYKRYLSVSKGNPIQDVIRDIRPIGSRGRERLGYPTQKPLALLSRIIQASSNPGDVVLDPFCGCGTAVEAASQLSRRWIGIDISSFAIDLIREKRLKYQRVSTQGIPYDYRSAKKLATEKPFSFESWAVTRLPGFAPNTKQRGDGGVDGRAKLYKKPDDWKSRLALAQVKGGGFNLSELRDFIHVTNRDNAALGVYVTLDPVTTRDARKEAATAKSVTVGAERYPRCQLWPITDHFDGRRPHLPTMNDPYTGKPMRRGLF